MPKKSMNNAVISKIHKCEEETNNSGRWRQRHLRCLAGGLFVKSQHLRKRQTRHNGTVVEISVSQGHLRSRQALDLRDLVGPVKEFVFYFKCNEKPQEGYRHMINTL